MPDLIRYLRLDTKVTTADKARILLAYVAVFVGLIAVGIMLLWGLWPYSQVRWEGDTYWKSGEVPVVQVGDVADITFVVPYVCNEEGHSLTFNRWIVSGPRDDSGSYFRWEIGSADLVSQNPEPYCLNDVPVRVVFPVLYNPGDYHVEIISAYKPNPLFPREAFFESPVFVVTEK